MAKPSWLTATPSSGSGDGTIINTGSVHTGRVNRTGTVTVTPTGTEAKTYQVIQTAKTEFVQFGDASVAISKDGGNVTIMGSSNSSKLTFSLGATNQLGLVAPTSYTAAGASAVSGQAIAGDPGAVSQFNFSVPFAIAANEEITNKTSELIVTDNAGNSSQIALVQTAGDAYLTIIPTTITIPADGTAQSVTVESNTSWTVS